jgi:hypothetical protein
MKWMFLFALLISLPFSARGLIHTDFATIPANVRWEIAYLIVFATLLVFAGVALVMRSRAAA